MILTSNVGSQIIEKSEGGILGFQFTEREKQNCYNRIKSLVNEEMKQYFRPEFLNRLDDVIVFRQLSKDEVKEIANIMLIYVIDRAKLNRIFLEVTDWFRVKLVD